MDLVYFLLLIGPLVFVHELGHFVVAKAFNIKVLKFSLGFGPKMVGRKVGETLYQVAWIPLGGYVKFLGDDPSEPLEPRDRGRTFLQAPIWKRALVVVAGPAMSLCFPIFCYFAVGLLQGEVAPPIIGQVIPGTPAESAGLRPGDRVVRVDGIRIRAFDDLRTVIGARAEKSITLEIDRGGELLRVGIRPARVRVPRFRQFDIYDEVGQIGIHDVFNAPVVGVASDRGPAARAGLRTFDLVTSVGGNPVERWIDLEQAFERPAGPLEVTYLRGENVGWPFADLFVQAPHETTVVLEQEADGPAGVGLEPASLYLCYVLSGTPAARAGARVGDKIVAWDGGAVRLWEEVAERMRRDPDHPHRLTVVREGRKHDVELRLERRVLTDRYGSEVIDFRSGTGVYWVGWVVPAIPNPNRVARAAVGAVESTIDVVRFMLVGFVRLAQRRVSLRSIGGPLMLFDLAGVAARQGAESFLATLALISVNLGLINLLPIPVLDGGHVALMVAEAVRRKPLSMKAREVATLIGFGLLVVVLIFAFKNDIERYWGWEGFGALFR